MKTNLLKYYTAAIYFCFILVTFAQPAADDTGGTLEGSDPAAAPIDSYVFVLLTIGIGYSFYKYKAIGKQTKVESIM